VKIYPVLTAALVIGLAPSLTAQPNDENMIRLAYAKAIFANQVGILETSNGKDVTQTLSTHQLKFSVSDFRSDYIAGNARPISDLVTRPDGQQLLLLSVRSWTYTRDSKMVGEETSLTAQWKRAPGEDPMNEEKDRIGWALPISDLVIDSPWAERFLTYHVTASYEGKSETYRAFALVGQDHLQIMDMITPSIGDMSVATLQQLYPAVVLRLLRDAPGVVDWLKANQVSNDACQSGELCCDVAAMKCGILPADLSRELEKSATNRLPFASREQ